MYRCKPCSPAPVLLIIKLLFCSSICLTHFFLNLSEPRWRRNPFIPNQNILTILKRITVPSAAQIQFTLIHVNASDSRLRASMKQRCPPDTGNLRQRTEVAPRQLHGDTQAVLTATLGQPCKTAAALRSPQSLILASSLLRSPVVKACLSVQGPHYPTVREPLTETLPRGQANDNHSHELSHNRRS